MKKLSTLIILFLAIGGIVVLARDERKEQPKLGGLSQFLQFNGKTIQEITKLKQDYILQYRPKGVFSDLPHGISVEIMSITIVDGGIQIYAKAWKNGQPIGFGTDGTIEIERFKFYNPPLLVPDSNGTETITTFVESTGQNIERKFRFDPKQAILNALAETIQITGKSGENIVQGKVGSTVSTFYPAATNGSCRIRMSGTIGSGFSAVRNAASGDNLNCGEVPQNIQSERDATHYYIGRGINSFDTSTIPDSDSVSAVTFSIYVVAVTNADSTRASLRKATPADPVNIANADYDTFTGNALSSDINLASISTGAYTDFTGNSDFNSAISKTSYTSVMTRNGSDIDDSAPTGLNSVDYYQAVRAGTTEDPKLVVTHTCDPSTQWCSEVYTTGGGYSEWTVPSNTTQADFACWGGGAGGADGETNAGGGGGGGGAFASTTQSVTAGQVYRIYVAPSVAMETMGATSTASTTAPAFIIEAQGGRRTTTNVAGDGGRAASSTGTTKFNGGTGGVGETGTGDESGGGGGSGGPHAAGGTGGNGTSSTVGGNGGQGDGTRGGAGGAGGNGACGNGSPGTANALGGGGGGGGDDGCTGGNGAAPGGGGGGGETGGGTGAEGRCQILYTGQSAGASATPNLNWDDFFIIL